MHNIRLFFTIHKSNLIFHYRVTRLVGADITGKWFKPIYEDGHSCTSYSDKSLKPLNLNNIYGVLAIWAAGMLTATIIFIVEKIYFSYSTEKFYKRKKKKKIRIIVQNY